MNDAVVNIKIERQLKKEAQKIAEELGFSLSSLLKAYLKTLIKTKTVTFSAQSEEPSEYLIKSLAQSEKDIKAGRVSPAFKSIEEEFAWLDNPNARYVNGDPVR